MGNEINKKLLLETVDEFVYLTVIQILKENNVPYIVKDDETGGYMKIIAGFSIYNKEVFVSKEDYERAYKLVENFIN
ncbi:DUF2007 domain-containing protein [Peptostreptococcaceae bacterium OttesenSCG-928-C18]|nr:DUF2007 domain-containing protein [Peptostreptococcaceae bacterium OttesenSCG-928-C18]